MNFDYKKHILCALTAGSHLYGTSTPESDEDIRGVLMPPAEYWLGMESFEQYEPEGEDTVYHELRKFLRLSAAGNPMFLEMWFSPPSIKEDWNLFWWVSLKADLWHAVLSKKLIKPHLGMAQAHLARIEHPGKKAGFKGLVAIEKYGYNTKDASHVLRVLYQALELLETGKLIFPRPEAPFLSEIRTGKHTLEAIRSTEAYLSAAVKAECERSSLRETPDFAAVNRWLVNHVPFMLEDFA